LPAINSSANGGAPRSSVVRSGTGDTAAAQPARDRERDAAIEALTLAVARLRRGAAALKAENLQLRAEVAGLHLAAAGRLGGDASTHGLGKLTEISLPTGSDAPGAARMVIAHSLTGLVSQPILGDVELLVAELVSNCVQHGELRDGDHILIRVSLAAETLRLEVENPGIAGVLTSSPLDRPARGDGFGLELVDRLATRWGVIRAASTKVWFEMGRA
jgi:anti-sigma regulatory factor (Ser/Thr protein kinase)